MHLQLTFLQSCDVRFVDLPSLVAVVQTAVEGLAPTDPELKVAGSVIFVAAESHLGWATGKHVDNLLIGHIALLKVLLDGGAAIVACAIFSETLAAEQKVGTGSIRLADVAVETSPAIGALT